MEPKTDQTFRTHFNSYHSLIKKASFLSANISKFGYIVLTFLIKNIAVHTTLVNKLFLMIKTT